MPSFFYRWLFLRFNTIFGLCSFFLHKIMKDADWDSLLQKLNSDVWIENSNMHPNGLFSVKNFMLFTLLKQINNEEVQDFIRLRQCPVTVVRYHSGYYYYRTWSRWHRSVTSELTWNSLQLFFVIVNQKVVTHTYNNCRFQLSSSYFYGEVVTGITKKNLLDSRRIST